MMAQKKFKKNLSFWIPAKHNKVHVSNIKTKQVATLQTSLRVTVIIGQIFSLMPFDGVFSSNASDVKFVNTSWKCMYTFLSLIGQIFMTVMCLHKLMNNTTTLMGTTPFIFYATTCVTMVMFLRMAKKWPELIEKISKTEKLDPNFDNTLTMKCNITCGVVLFLALTEHILSLLSAFAGGELCHPKLGTYEGFVRHFYPWVFNYIPYSLLLGITTQFLHFQSTFIWNFSDLFVICMSYYLTSLLGNVNKKLLAAQGKQPRRDGVKGTGECSSRARKTTLLGGYEAPVYFIFSLVYLITRSIAVSLIASQVNTASNLPAPVLYDVPSPVYCVEVQRFLDQVNGDNVALSGLQFFSVTKGLLLTVAGTIVTYELVMFQFNSPSPPSNSTMIPNVSNTDY